MGSVNGDGAGDVPSSLKVRGHGHVFADAKICDGAEAVRVKVNPIVLPIRVILSPSVVNKFPGGLCAIADKLIRTPKSELRNAPLLPPSVAKIPGDLHVSGFFASSAVRSKLSFPSFLRALATSREKSALRA